MTSWGKLQTLFVSTIQQIFLKKYVWLDASNSVDFASSVLCISVFHFVQLLRFFGFFLWHGIISNCLCWVYRNFVKFSSNLWDFLSFNVTSITLDWSVTRISQDSHLLARRIEMCSSAKGNAIWTGSRP